MIFYSIFKWMRKDLSDWLMILVVTTYAGQTKVLKNVQNGAEMMRIATDSFSTTGQHLLATVILND